jgi:hypothetical protein
MSMLEIALHPVYLVWVWPPLIIGAVFAIITKD